MAILVSTGDGTTRSRKGEDMRKLLRVAVVFSIVVGLMAIGMAAFAGTQPETFTEHERDFTDTFTDSTFCINGSEEETVVSIVENGVFHATFWNDELSLFTGSLVGAFVADPVDPALPTYTGRYTVWFGDNQNQNVDNATATFRLNGSAADGSKVAFGFVHHVTADSIIFDDENHDLILDGVRSEFFNARCK
jgi:hypothetical protein